MNRDWLSAAIAAALIVSIVVAFAAPIAAPALIFRPSLAAAVSLSPIPLMAILLWRVLGGSLKDSGWDDPALDPE